LVFRSDESTDCGDQICVTEYKILPTCHLFVPSGNCSIPCEMINCQVELHHNIRCPIICCYPKTTTTTSTVSPMPTVSPSPKSGSVCQSGLCISSVSLNAILLVAFVLAIIFGRRYVKKLKLQRQYSRIDEESPIIRGYSNVELSTPRNETSNEENANSFWLRNIGARFLNRFRQQNVASETQSSNTAESTL